MGDSKFTLGGITFPLTRLTKFSFVAMPARSGGTVLRDSITKGNIDLLVGVKNKPKVMTRITIPDAFGIDKKIMIHEDWMQLGDRLYERVKYVGKRQKK